jgi:hypothetical protein
MLEPEGRQLLLNALRPPADFTLDYAIGTTYTLDLTALLTAPVGFALLDREASDGRAMTDPVALLEAVRRNAERIHIFCQAGAIALPSNHQPILSYVEDSIHEVVAPTQGAIFHPKIWVIRYKATDGSAARIRLLVLSRNLTFDRSWDTILQLEGVAGHRESPGNEPLARFLRSLSAMAREPLGAPLTEAIEALAVELARVRFDLPPDFESYMFWPLGLDPAPPWPFPRRADRLLVVSPFLTQDLLGRLVHGSRGADVLVSRPESLDRLGSRALASFAETFILSGDTTPAEESDPEAVTEEAVTLASPTVPEAVVERPGTELRGLHAKLFVTEVGDRVQVWTGSANATGPAFGGNVEFLVELGGRKDRVGIDKVIGDGGDTLSLLSLLERYPPISVEPTEPSPEEALERRLEVASRSLAGYSFVARVEPGLGDEYMLRLVGTRAAVAPPPVDWTEFETKCWPLTLAAAYAVPVHPGGDAIALDFGSRSFESLTSFFAFEVTGRMEGIDVKVRFLVNARLEGAPADRRARTLANLLTNRGDLLRFLLFLLGGDAGSGEMVELGPRLLEVLSRDPSNPKSMEWQNLFEPMVLALARDRGKLDAIARLVRDLERTDAGRDLLPEDWSEIWEPIWNSRTALQDLA